MDDLMSNTNLDIIPLGLFGSAVPWTTYSTFLIFSVAKCFGR